MSEAEDEEPRLIEPSAFRSCPNSSSFNSAEVRKETLFQSIFALASRVNTWYEISVLSPKVTVSSTAIL